MQLPDGTLKKGLFENNIFIEEISEVDEDRESSMMSTTQSPQLYSSKAPGEKAKAKKKKSKFKKKKDLTLPFIDDHQSGRQYSSTKKVLNRDHSEPVLTRRNKKNFSSFGSGKKRKHNASSALLERNKESLSLPKINGSKHESSAMSARLKGFEGAAKNQAAERKKLESYFKSLDKAVQILRQKRQREMANRPWIPAGPVRSYEYRPSSRVYR